MAPGARSFPSEWLASLAGESQLSTYEYLTDVLGRKGAVDAIKAALPLVATSRDAA